MVAVKMSQISKVVDWIGSRSQAYLNKTIFFVPDRLEKWGWRKTHLQLWQKETAHSFHLKTKIICSLAGFKLWKIQPQMNNNMWHIKIKLKYRSSPWKSIKHSIKAGVCWSGVQVFSTQSYVGDTKQRLKEKNFAANQSEKSYKANSKQQLKLLTSGSYIRPIFQANSTQELHIRLYRSQLAS